MSTATTRNVGTNVIVQWVAPFDNSDILTSYRIYIKAKNHTYYESPSCVANTIPLPLSCSIPQTELQASPFLLV